MIHVTIRERDASAKATEPITSGSVGLPVCFRFSEEWKGLAKIAVFRGSGRVLDMALSQDLCAVPHEVLLQSGGMLKIGVYGTGENGQKVTPTVWSDAGIILPGAEPSGLEPEPATESLVQQLLEAAKGACDAAEEAERIAGSVREDADAGAFDGAQGPAGPPGPPGEGGEDLFWATYGTTTAAEVADALSAEKLVAVRYLERVYSLSRIGDLGADRLYSFTNAWGNAVSMLTLYSTSWTNEGSQTIPPASSSNPSALGTATPGTSSYYARADHVHPMPSAADVGAAPAVTEVTVSAAGAVTQALDAGKLYHFTGALTALTITLNAAPSGQLAQYHFDFNCGSTAPTVTIPSTVILPDGSSFEADRHYEVDILNNYGAVVSWANS